MSHDIVSGVFLLGGSRFEVDFVPVGFHLLDLRIINFQSEFLLVTKNKRNGNLVEWENVRN